MAICWPDSPFRRSARQSRFLPLAYSQPCPIVRPVRIIIPTHHFSACDTFPCFLKNINHTLHSFNSLAIHCCPVINLTRPTNALKPQYGQLITSIHYCYPFGTTSNIRGTSPQTLGTYHSFSSRRPMVEGQMPRQIPAKMR